MECTSAQVSVLGLSQRGHSIGNAIQKILRAESIHCCWRSIGGAANPIRGSAVTWLTVPHPAGDTLYTTRKGVESQGAAAIETRYKVAWGAPILQDARLHGDFGFLANTVLADQVLQGSYIYPKNMDTHTKLLLQEARHIFHRLLKEEIVDFVLTTDLQSYWQHANKDIQSSESGCHFRHYKAISFDCYLSAMHAAKLTLAASTGIPLACWGNGLTVLFEKVFGNIYINKMQAICLLEANYNWLNKFVFAKQMMDKAFEENIIPAEQFAKRGSQATEGVPTSGLFCNIAQALHKTAAIESVDLANCYDDVAHPIAMITLQSFKVCKVMVAMMLYVLKTMTWYLKTAFGQSKISFGGTALNPSMAWARAMVHPPRLPSSLHTDNKCIPHNLGHGVMFIGAWAQDAFTLAAVLYVDDSDLFHMAIRMPSDKEFLQLVQSATNNWAGLVHVTGGSLKPQKCFWYMLGWVWKNGKARLKNLYELPQNPLYIPQQDGTKVPICLKAISDPEKKLGVYTCPTVNFSYHVAHILTTGLEYAERLGTQRLLVRDTWMGTWYQLLPKLIYGAAAVTHSPQKLEDAFESIWYKLLPSLCVNRNIMKEYRILPLQF